MVTKRRKKAYNSHSCAIAVQTTHTHTHTDTRTHAHTEREKERHASVSKGSNTEFGFKKGTKNGKIRKNFQRKSEEKKIIYSHLFAIREWGKERERNGRSIKKVSIVRDSKTI